MCVRVYVWGGSLGWREQESETKIFCWRIYFIYLLILNIASWARCQIFCGFLCVLIFMLCILMNIKDWFYLIWFEEHKRKVQNYRNLGGIFLVTQWICVIQTYIYFSRLPVWDRPTNPRIYSCIVPFIGLHGNTFTAMGPMSHVRTRGLGLERRTIHQYHPAL